MGTQHFGGSPANVRIGVAQMVRCQLGEWFCEFTPVDQHLQGMYSQLAVSIAGAREQGRVVQRVETLEGPQAMDSLAGRRSGLHDGTNRSDGGFAAALDKLINRRDPDHQVGMSQVGDKRSDG